MQVSEPRNALPSMVQHFGGKKRLLRQGGENGYLRLVQVGLDGCH